MTVIRRGGRPNVIRREAQRLGLSEVDYLRSLIQQHGTQEKIALALGITQSAVSNAFVRNGFRPIIVYEVA